MKKITVGILFIGLLLMASSASASDDWWNTSYQYRVPITLTGNTSGAQTNYQLMLNVSYDSNMQPDFDDLRFTDDSGNLQSAWLENKTDSSWADIWVNFTSTPADGITQTYYMYYGNTEVSNYWNGSTTFDGLFDNFEDGDTTNGPLLSTTTNFASSNYTRSGGYSAKITDADGDYIDTAVLPSAVSLDNHIVSFWIYFVSPSGRRATLYSLDTSGNNGIFLKFEDSVVYKYTTAYVDTGMTFTSGWNQVEWIPKTTITSMRINSGAWVDVNNKASINNFKKIVQVSGADLFLDYYDEYLIRKYVTSPPASAFGNAEEYIPPPTPTSETPTPTPTPLKEITASNYVIQNQTLYITQPCNLQYKITSNSFVYGGLRNINTVICDNNNTVISGWFKISTDQIYDADYTFLINVNDTSYQSKIITIKQEQVDSSIISKTYRRSLIIDGYEIYSYNTTVYIVSILPNPIYFYFNLEDRTIQFGDKQFNNQTLVFNQLNFDDQYEFMNNASSDTVVMKFKAINPEQKSGAELKGLTGILLNALSKIPFIGKSFKNVLYYPLFFIQTIFDFVFTFLDLIVNDWWYGLMLMEIVCIFAASRNKGYANVMEVYIDTHVKIIKFIYEWIILKTINLIITIVVTIKDMIKWW